MKLSEISIEPYDTLLLDRDGTINVHLIGDYVKRWDEFEFIPGVLETMPLLAQHFKHIFIVTNQRGIGKGKYTEEDLTDIHRHMLAKIEQAGGRIDNIYYCTSLTDDDIRRKPGRGMFDDILRDYPDVEPSKTLMVGDGDVDEKFAENCGIDFCRVDSLKKDNGVYNWIKAEIMEVIILAGGLGTRLRSVVSEVPKCMAPVAGKPFLWYLLKYLSRYDVSRVILSVGYLREVIFKWIDEVKGEFPFAFDYAVEEEPLGTGGGIRLAMSKVRGKEAVILNGDTFFDVDLNKLIEEHQSHAWAKITLALKPMTDFDRYGTVTTSGYGRIIRFNEKQPCSAGVINGGVYVLNNDAELYEGLTNKFSFETDVLQKKCGENGCLYGVVQDGYFIDIGIPEDYNRSQYELKDLKR